MPLRNGGPSYNDISPGYVASSANRWHLSMHKCRNEPAKATLAECERLWLDDWIPTFLRPGFSRTQFQLLRSEPGPGGADQGFHQDNSRRGLTVLVPLCDVPVERGPTQLLLGSHALTGAGGGGRWRRGAGGGAGLVTEAFDNLGAVLPRASLHAPALRKGDVLVYDSRVLHRGLENRDSEARPCLVFRYDEEGCAPPGHGPLSTVVFRQIGNALALLARL
jgi:ectoine hydroxylase-related dioxygenase (phytanoyl-CoA dioxygenase family)